MLLNGCGGHMPDLTEIKNNAGWLLEGEEQVQTQTTPTPKQVFTEQEIQTSHWLQAPLDCHLWHWCSNCSQVPNFQPGFLGPCVRSWARSCVRSCVTEVCCPSLPDSRPIWLTVLKLLAAQAESGSWLLMEGSSSSHFIKNTCPILLEEEDPQK